MPAREIGLHRDPLRRPPVREAGGRGGVGHQHPGTYCDLETIVHEAFLSAAVTRGSLLGAT
jgi:hypothetical protein